MGQMTNEEYLTGIQNGLLDQLGKHKEALPPGFNKERFILNSITVIRDMMKDEKQREKLQDVKMETIPLCLAKGAYLGLDFFNGECYAIPYKGNMQFQTDYKGEIKLCKRYSKNPIKDIFAKAVREGDFFEEEIDCGVQRIIYKPKPFSNAGIIGAFAIVVYKDGSMLYDTMSKEEIEKVRNTYSKAKDSPAWRNSPGEMYKKTVIRRLCKSIDLDFDSIEQVRAYEDGGDAVFENTMISESPRAELPEKEKPVDVFAQAKAKRREPAPVVPNSDQESEFLQFEEMYGRQGNGGYGYGADAMLPEMLPEDELPFR